MVLRMRERSDRVREALTVLAKVAVAAALLLATPRDSSAEIFGFDCISTGAPTDCAILEAQLSVNVTAGVEPNQVAFQFTNSGPSASSISEIYFQDPIPLLGALYSISSSAGVSYTSNCNPNNLPGGAPLGFTTTYCAERSGNQQTGVNPGESVTIIYTLQSGYDLDDVLAAINDGSYRMGLHVIGFADRGSVSGIDTPNTSVPEPTSLLFVTTGLLLGGLGLNRRRKR